MAAEVSAAEAKSRLGEFEVIIDVRSQGEWDNGHLELPTVHHVERLHANPEKVPELAELADKKVLVHCEAGLRAKKAGAMLLAAGFKDLTIVAEGGYSLMK